MYPRRVSHTFLLFVNTPLLAHMSLPYDRDVRFCNFMHLSHPSLNLVKSLEHSQRLEMRKVQANPLQDTSGPNGNSNGNGVGGGDALGWVPGRMATGGGGGGGAGDAGWVPPAKADDEGVYEGDSWKPSY